MREKKETEVEVIRSKGKHDFKELVDAPFEMMDYTKKQDQLLIEYRKQEIELLNQILEELKKISRTKW